MKCPVCEREIDDVIVKEIDGRDDAYNPFLDCLAFICPQPNCKAIISVSLDIRNLLSINPSDSRRF